MGLFSKLFKGLKKTKDAIGDKFVSLFSHGEIDDDFYDELEDILISSDVGVSASEEIIEGLREKVREEKLRSGEEVKRALRCLMADMLESAGKFEIEAPAVIMVVGVNGVGKTTTIGKLAAKWISQKKSVVIAAADTFRAAASDQLSVWADRAGVRIIKHAEGADPSAVVFDAASSAKAKKTDVLIIDTAGRLHNKANLMEELKKMNRVLDREYPEANRYKLIAIDATTGQNAISQVSYFDEAVGIDGIILTKLDGTAKGGVVLNLCNQMQIPVAYVGVGEQIDDLEEFDAEEFAEALI